MLELFLRQQTHPKVRFVAFLLLAAILFERALTGALLERAQLLEESVQVSKQLVAAKSVNAELKATLAGSEDPQWVELALMRVLGLVPDGYQKILFKEG